MDDAKKERKKPDNLAKVKRQLRYIGQLYTRHLLLLSLNYYAHNNKS